MKDQTRIIAPAVTVLSLPAGPINRHWMRNIIASEDGSKLYVTVGLNINVAENGIEKEQGRAAGVSELDLGSDGSASLLPVCEIPTECSWDITVSLNRVPHSGYKVTFVPFKEGKPSGRAARCAHWISQCRRQGAGPPGRRFTG